MMTFLLGGLGSGLRHLVVTLFVRLSWKEEMLMLCFNARWDPPYVTFVQQSLSPLGLWRALPFAHVLTWKHNP